MTYNDNTQGKTTSKDKLPTREQLKVDPPSTVGFWPKDIGTASGQDAGDLAENFNAPHGGRSRGQKYPNC
jgi:hypothetical protein